jgi:hypothetical protein
VQADAALFVRLDPRDPVGQHLVYQRLLAIEAGFADAAARRSLSADVVEPLRRVYNRFDDETGRGGFAGRIKTLLAQRLLPFARLFAVARDAQSINFQAEKGFAVSRQVVGDDVADDLLRDEHAGWRFVGLARASSDPSSALVDAMFGAIGFEATWELHIDWFVRGVAALVEREPGVAFTSQQRGRLDEICRRMPGDASSRVLDWLHA